MSVAAKPVLDASSTLRLLLIKAGITVAPLGTLLAHLDASAMMAHMASISPEVLLLCIVMILTLSAIVAFRVRACFLSAVSDRLFALVAVVLCTIASPRPRRSFVWLKKSPIRTSRSSFARG